MSDIQRVGVVGSGLMGSGIAEVSARAGLDVIVAEVNASASEAAQARIASSLARGVKSGKLSEADRDAALARIRFTTDIGDFGDRQFVVEAVAENEQIKTEVFTTLDKVVKDEDAIFASNTSSIPIMKLGMATLYSPCGDSTPGAEGCPSTWKLPLHDVPPNGRGSMAETASTPGMVASWA